jgi:hypothetical protein
MITMPSCEDGRCTRGDRQTNRLQSLRVRIRQRGKVGSRSGRQFVAHDGRHQRRVANVPSHGVLLLKVSAK